MYKRKTSTTRSGKVVDPFYKSKPWYRLRWAVLQRDSFTCTGCGIHIGRKGAHVDHVVPRSRDRRRELDPANCVTLCHSCHSAKTCRKEGGFGNAPGREEYTGGCSVEGVPLQEGHPWYEGEE